ncbi:hypothetical protein LUZ60_010990 [Juncus effusus]|nr:hypothetical protein LUZ60_010990 [Juncus effusus]
MVEMVRSWKERFAILLLCLLTVCEEFEPCACFNQEDWMLWRVREMKEFDTHDGLFDWDEARVDSCSWMEIECSKDGRILAMTFDLCLKDDLSPEIVKLCDDIFFTGNGFRILETQSDQVNNENTARNNINGIIRRILQASPPTPTKSPKPKSSPVLSSKSESKTKEKNQKPAWILYVSIGAAICVALVLSAGLYYIWKKVKNAGTINPWSTGLSGHIQKAFVTGVPALKRTEIEAACENFSNIINTLQDNEFYKGTLSNGSEITVISSLVTSPSDWSQQSETYFRNKILSLSKVNHKNFMNLVGYCEEEEPFTRIMVFEYAPNGTLFEHLHIKEAEQLDWPARLRIAMGVIYCLEHMHSLNPKVTLETLNSSSVYLTEDYAAKLTDPKLFLQSKKDSDSDYDYDSDSDEENITYKFGVLLLEMISGRRQFSNDDGLLVLWASSYLNGQRPVLTMLDQTLKDANIPQGQIRHLVEVLKDCINQDRNQRPTVADVAERMRGITGISPQQAVPRLSPLWWAELEVLGDESRES